MPIDIPEKKFELARNTLLEQDIIKVNITEEDTAEKKLIEEDTKSKKIVVLSGVSLENFCKLRAEARKFKIYIRLVKGEIIVYETPSPVHSFTTGYLSNLIGAWSNYLDVGGELDMTVSHDTEYISDIVIEPIQPLQPGQQQLGPAPPGSVPMPRMIIEVGRYESIGSLHSLAKEYFSNSTQTNLIQVYLSIKIFPRQSAGTAAMVAMIYLRDNQIPGQNRPNASMITVQNTQPNLVISFGTAPLHQESIDIINSTGIRNYRFIGFLQPEDIACTNAGMPNYQIDIPSNLLFNGFPGGVPQGTPNNLNIDLWEVQQRILRHLVSA
ncbi:hypothetical protein RhiirA4_510727 [Rhizophagus irregularis]|uniref:Restriction endonuclease domain-containing protein n=1 Tax=Rhizophagus irregularis TaxID=588596 RepID=A0A2I1HFW2_9GLOM|nr:hypothetical protein RhiirA4_510727 [Rhizophagus irregularis]